MNREQLKNTIQEIIREELTEKKQPITEKLEPSDYNEIRDMIRAEIALIFFDFYKKRNMWI